MRYTEEFEDEAFDREMPPTLIKRLKPFYVDKATARRLAARRNAIKRATVRCNAARLSAAKHQY